MTRNAIDSTIEEIHQTRRAISDRFGGDIKAIAEDAARRLAESNRPVWQPPPDEQTTAPESTAAPDEAM
jgi:hypothetical protein